jgi:hypothetical protein
MMGRFDLSLLNPPPFFNPLPLGGLSDGVPDDFTSTSRSSTRILVIYPHFGSVIILSITVNINIIIVRLVSRILNNITNKLPFHVRRFTYTHKQRKSKKATRTTVRSMRASPSLIVSFLAANAVIGCGRAFTGTVISPHHHVRTFRSSIDSPRSTTTTTVASRRAAEQVGTTLASTASINGDVDSAAAAAADVSGRPPATSEASTTTVEDAVIPTKLPSDVGMDYIPLATMLATGQLAEADQVCLEKILRMSVDG